MQENRNLQARDGSILLTLSSPKECVLIFAFDGFVEGGLRVTSLKTRPVRNFGTQFVIRVLLQRLS